MASWKFSSGVASAPIQRITSFEFSFEPPSSYFITLSGGPFTFLSKETRQLCSLSICSESEFSKRGCWPEQPVSHLNNSFSHHQQGRIDFNTVNPSLPTRNIVGFRKQNLILGDKLRLCCGNSGPHPPRRPFTLFCPKRKHLYVFKLIRPGADSIAASVFLQNLRRAGLSLESGDFYISLKRGC